VGLESERRYRAQVSAASIRTIDITKPIDYDAIAKA
jgi:hypothetical protein